MLTSSSHNQLSLVYENLHVSPVDCLQQLLRGQEQWRLSCGSPTMLGQLGERLYQWLGLGEMVTALSLNHQTSDK